MKNMLISLFPILTIIGIFLISNQIVFADPLMELLQDDTRATTWFLSIKPLDNWAYQNANYAPDNIFGIKSNNAVEMYPNEFTNHSMVYGMFATDPYYTMKNTGLDQYVQFKMNNPNLKYINGSKLLSKSSFDINGTKAIKLTYDDPNGVYKLALYLMQHNKENHLVYYRTTIDLFDKYIPEFEQMIQTIKWVD